MHSSPSALFSPLIEQAIELAAQWHDLTYRKSRWREAAFEVPPGQALRVPAMAHATAVAMIVQRAGWEDAVVAAAFLHDALEDANCHGQTLLYDRLQRLMGEEVAVIVRAVTEQKFGQDSALRGWRARKEDYVAHLHTAPVGAVAVSLADKWHNVWSINQALTGGIDVFTPAADRRPLTAGPNEQLWFHRAVLRASEAHPDPRLPALREGLAAEIERFARLSG